MPPPKVTTASEDPIQEAYGVPEDALPPLMHAPAAAAPGPAPEGIGHTPGGAKWPRGKALAYLAAQPKLPVYIPLSRDEEGKTGLFFQDVTWNGWRLMVPKGQTVYVPLSIAELINQSMERYRTVQARTARGVDMMLVTPENPGGLLVSEYSDPAAVEMYRRGAPLHIDD